MTAMVQPSLFYITGHNHFNINPIEARLIPLVTAAELFADERKGARLPGGRDSAEEEGLRRCG